MTKREMLGLLDELLELEPGTLTGNEELGGLENWDSLAVMGFIQLADERCGRRLTGQAITSCRSVNDLVALLGGDGAAGEERA